ncbi:hypothetical protein [Devosia submarina]|uniref:hypothetical protein n=1 Tax=Devosia submarina TaxID=1173082 RepID=UPI0013002772|nr:hypothetical protein [Devosia submarina]
MTLKLLKRTLLAGGATALLVGATWPFSVAQEMQVEGVFALPDVSQKVSGDMVLEETGPLSRAVELVYTDLATNKQVSKFDVELTQELHILAVDAELTTLVHRHVEEANDEGVFAAELDFPKPGLYHIYTDAVPSGMGQQVLRFDASIGAGSKETPRLPAPSASSGPISSGDGEYTVTLDPSQLRAGAESLMTLSVEKNGKPAQDLAPYLGVAAHAVLVRAEDLAYVHAHAMSDGAEQHGSETAMQGHDGHHSSGGHGHAGHSQSATTPATSHGAHGHGAADHPPAQTSRSHSGHGDHGTIATAISPEMSIHVTPPAPGTYALWIEFIGGEEVLTVPFTIEIPEQRN